MSLNGNGCPTAAEWLAQAKEHIQDAIDCLGQISSVVDTTRVDLMDTPSGRGFRGMNMNIRAGEKLEELENAEDEIARLICYLNQVDWAAVEGCKVDSWEKWGAAAQEAADRAGRI